MRKLQSKRNLKQLNLSPASEALSPWPGLLCPFSASLNLRDSFILELDFYLQDSSQCSARLTRSAWTLMTTGVRHSPAQNSSRQIVTGVSDAPFMVG